ncbi:aspartate-semialdehyde dehydrogenase [Texcoconibacillus texcoconensis]|uniref:Aspartate-semialdehyde dehydrogenase n=1 Tax=Texcoconibacillus texcoconensis TaxID=1095777 RepID=A0A840QH92_9BACI|nr:aspartate-semialdehyde dehydrogenase [Texcoconibacillus texcoconensis]MBB5172022.1 aspartate-semialdehyde dehydrogenase [Texcoconibacillus texcoconensis]
MNNKLVNVAVVGATGAVGEQMLEILEERSFPVNTLKLLSSKRSAGKTLTFKGEEYVVEEATEDSFEGIDIALFSAGGSVSKRFADAAVKSGAVVIDNTSAFRMDENVPLVVPEVNVDDVSKHNGIISNPNCSTIQMVAALEPLREAFGLNRVIVSTYQAVSGAGVEAVDEMNEQSKDVLEGRDFEAKVLPVSSDEKYYQIAFNAVPQIDKFEDNGYTFEELKMINETKKILHDDQLPVAATCVRLPVATGHSESVYIEVDKDGVTVNELREQLEKAPGITVTDDPSNQVYPMATDAAGQDDIFVGRMRKDLDNEKGFHLWVVADNLRKGAALNSIQIAESLLKKELI